MIRMTYTTGVLESSAFAALREAILAEVPPRLLDQPLAAWALPTDRALPRAHLGRPLRKLLATSFESLCSVRGMGPKKVACLLELLRRVAPTPADAPATRHASSSQQSDAAQLGSSLPARTSPGGVTAHMWDAWRLTVLRQGLGRHNVGQFARSLLDLPCRVWDEPLESFASLTLGEVNALHAFGEKRIHALLEIFSSLHDTLGQLDAPQHLSVAVVPPLAARLSAWVAATAPVAEQTTAEDVCEHFAVPLVGQLAIDAGGVLAATAGAHLNLIGNHRAEQSDDEPSPGLGTYYRRKIAAIVRARWPAGTQEVAALIQRWEQSGNPTAGLDLFQRAVDVFFPSVARSERPLSHNSAVA